MMKNKVACDRYECTKANEKSVFGKKYDFQKLISVSLNKSLRRI